MSRAVIIDAVSVDRAGRIPTRPWMAMLVALAMAIGGSCATAPQTDADPAAGAPAGDQAAESSVAEVAREPRGFTDDEASEGSASAAGEEADTVPTRDSVIIKGTGRFINERVASKPRYKTTPSGEIVLEFEGTDIKEVVRSVLGDLLALNYVIDDKVSGKVTLNTSSPISADALLPVLETVLSLNGAAMVRQDSLYMVVPTAGAAVGSIAPRLRPSSGAGFQTVVVPLRYVAAEDMLKMLSAMQPGGGGKDAVVTGIKADKRRNLLIASGTEAELRQMLETVDLFDVDQFAGMSVGLFRLNFLDSEQMIEELQTLAADAETGPLSNMVRFMPVQRINSILVITSQPRYLAYIEEWIERLDRSDLVAGLGLYVYPVKNRDAAQLAEVLQNLYVSEETTVERRARVAPGLQRRVTEVDTGTRNLPAVGTAKLQRQFSGTQSDVAEAAVMRTVADDSASVGAVRIIADEDNNALIVMASAEDYAKIEVTIRRLDVRPLQVLIEATIIDVTLDGLLRYGVEWFFKNNNVWGDDYTGEGRLDLGGPGIGIPQGFSYAIIDSFADVRFVVNLLERESKVNILSSPSLMVQDNNTASIRVGNQVPVITESATTEGGVIIESVQFKDTGVLLTVKPRVNEGGLVSLEVSQEVTDAGAIDPATGQRVFLQRTIDSTVAVQTGQTVVLGGLITENETEAEEGVPVLKDVPGVGWLFKSTDLQSNKAELLVLLTPRVVRSDEDLQLVLDEMRGRMQGLDWEAYDQFRPVGRKRVESELVVDQPEPAGLTPPQ
ncbi:MAG: type II secretion system secretin GspD [Chromatiales bacterium]